MLDKNWMESRYTIGSLVARSAAMQRVVKLASLQIESPARLLIVGETGTGKTVLARAIHNSSSRAGKPFVAVAAHRLTPNSLDNVLLGTPGEPGVFARAEGGTMILTGIEDLSPLAQERIGQVLDSGVYTNTAGQRVPVETRMMFTAHSGELAERISRGMFAEDMYSRISQAVISMPTLAERNADIPYLVSDVLQAFAARERVTRPSVPYHYMELLTRVEWPENVRQLRNHVESVMSLSSGKFDPEILLAHFEEIESPQTLRGLVHDLLQKLVAAPKTASAMAGARQ